MNQLHSDDLESLHHWLSEATARGPVAIITGKNGDMDTVGSAIALSSTHPNFMACGVHLGRVARRLVESHRAPFRQLKSGREQWPSSISAVVVVDAAAADQTGLDLPDVPKCILDHHATDDWQLQEGDFSLKWDVRSTTEMVARYMLGHAKEQMTGPVCEFLLAGLVTDTGRFRHANAGSFDIAASLIKNGQIDYQSFIQSMEDEQPSPSDQGAILRGLQRTELTEAGPWRVLRSTAGTLEGRVASLLSGIGADAVVVTRHRHGETRLTVRASRSSVLEGLHLGSIMEGLSESLGGDGGGHDGAAGWSGQADPVAAESAFIDAVARTERGK